MGVGIGRVVDCRSAGAILVRGPLKMAVQMIDSGEAVCLSLRLCSSVRSLD